ncbi:MAG: molybdenum cofactor guanylyltransferase [Planctomycetota bacterium]
MSRTVDQRGARLSVVILAGGEASRLGGHKLDRLVGGRPLIECVLELSHSLSDDVLLLAGERRLPPRAPGDVAERPPLRILPDAPDLVGPVAGLVAGLSAARHEWTLLLACDMPFVDPRIVHWMACRALETRAHVIALELEGAPGVGAEGPPVAPRPRIERPLLAPFPALFNAAALPRIVARAQAGERSLQGLLRGLLRLRITRRELAGLQLTPHTLTNVNTPAELAKARRAASSAVRPGARRRKVVPS